jgi:S-formylglutathione hydrolase FrmB
MRSRWPRRDGLRGFLAAACLMLTAGRAAAVEFRITLDPQVAPQPVSGRLYVFLSQRAAGEPRFGPDWFHPEPFFRLDVKDFRPGSTQTIGDSAAGFPDKLSRLPAGTYRAQAVLANDLDIYSCEPGHGAGNVFSPIVTASLSAAPGAAISLTLNQVVKEEAFPDIKWIKEVVVKSNLLTKFHHREVLEHAAVVLPTSYFDQPDQRYPVIYMVPSFGGSYREALQFAKQPPHADPGDEEFIRVMLDGQCDWGHHVYADSATNGPRGQALVAEMIPEIDKQFRTVANPAARFVAGHSSGGWSSLWLQVTYPDVFGGVWSSSPDPVDFRDFQRIDLYADPPQNMFHDPQGIRRPIARHGETPVVWFDAFSKMDDVLGRGGQLRSFEAVFSPLDAAGLPRRLWDRTTGQVDAEVAKAWRPYDIRLKLERNWKELEPKLRGKLHITTGSLDTFYLEGSVVWLAESLRKLGSDAQITIVPGADHSTVITPDYFIHARRQMTEAYRSRSAR